MFEFESSQSRQNAKDRIGKSTTKALNKVITFRKYDVPFPCATVKRVAYDFLIRELTIAERIYDWVRSMWCALDLKKA